MVEFWAEVKNFTKSSRRHLVEQPQLAYADQKNAPYKTERSGYFINERNDIPTFEEFLEFVLSTDLRGKTFFKLNVNNKSL